MRSAKLLARMRRLVVLAVLGALLCAGCKVDATTAILLNEDGSGRLTVSVRFDGEAVSIVERSGRPIEESFVLDDLREAGWKLSRWRRGADGAAVVSVRHDFADEDELVSLIADLTGDDGVLRDVRVNRSRSLIEQRDGVSLVADLTGLRSGVRDDAELATRLRAAGVDVDAVDYVLGAQLRRAFTLRVRLVVPREDPRTFVVNAGERDTVNLASTELETNRIAVLLIGAMLVFLALLLYLSASISARRRRARDLEFAVVRARRGRSQPLM
jgi:hypothetical protein